MQTTLNLLTRDGAFYMSFSPSLQASQYAELLRISEIADSADELRLHVTGWAAEQGLKCSFDPAKEPHAKST